MNLKSLIRTGRGHPVAASPFVSILMIAGLVIVGFMARSNNRHLFGNPKGGET